MIDTKNWKEYRIADVFDVSRPDARSAQKYESGEMPFVASGCFNNGVVNYLKPKSEDDYDKGNCLTVSPVDGYSFYQKHDFLGRGGAGSSIIVLRNKNLNEYNGLFICTVIRISCSKWIYSDMGNKDTIAETIIKLPSDKDGNPDFAFMESFMRSVMKQAKKRVDTISTIDDSKKEIDIKEWKSFLLGDLFKKCDLKRKKEPFNKLLDCSEEQTTEFSLPLTNAKHFNNGIQFYGRPEDWECEEMTIDIVSNGAIATGDVYAQPQKTGVLWDSYLIKCIYDIKSEYALHFLACVIEKCVKQFFGWDNKCTWEKVKEKSIKLPVTDTGDPDFAYMDSYMKTVMRKAKKAISDFQKV